MKIFKLLAVFMVAGLFLTGCEDELRTPDQDIDQQEMTLKGGELVGAHYNLNIIGVQNEKTADMTGSNGHVIFVPMEGKIAIELQEAPEGESFMVIDGNGTDGVAQFQLPNPGLDPYIIGGDMEGVDTESDYSVFVRPLGKPGGWSTITTCADVVESSLANFISKQDIKVLNDLADLGGVASIEQVGQSITMRTKGKTTFTNVTAQLLTIVLRVQYDDDGDGIVDDDDPILYVRVPIFDPLIENEYWEYDNHGLKLLQVRFYPIGTDVSDWDLDDWKI